MCDKKNTVLIVLCLAGLGQRFLDGGYKTPKFLLLNNENPRDTIVLGTPSAYENWINKIQEIGF